MLDLQINSIIYNNHLTSIFIYFFIFSIFILIRFITRDRPIILVNRLWIVRLGLICVLRLFYMMLLIIMVLLLGCNRLYVIFGWLFIVDLWDILVDVVLVNFFDGWIHFELIIMVLYEFFDLDDIFHDRLKESNFWIVHLFIF